MRVLSLRRHPVKSMQGEVAAAVDVDELGVVGDRAYGVLDLATGRILSAKWEPRLLAASAREEGGEPVVTLPDGATVTGLGARTDAALSAWLGREVSLRSAASSAAVFQAHADPLDDTSEEVEWTGPDGSFRDSAPAHLLTTATLRAMASLAPAQQWDVRRFRPNVLVEVDGDGFVEDEWVGARLRIGEVELDVFKRAGRCSMVAREQPDGIVADADVIRALRGAREMKLGVYAAVVRGGRIEAGARVERLGG